MRISGINNFSHNHMNCKKGCKRKNEVSFNRFLDDNSDRVMRKIFFGDIQDLIKTNPTHDKAIRRQIEYNRLRDCPWLYIYTDHKTGKVKAKRDKQFLEVFKCNDKSLNVYGATLDDTIDVDLFEPDYCSAYLLGVRVLKANHIISKTRTWADVYPKKYVPIEDNPELGVFVSDYDKEEEVVVQESNDDSYYEEDDWWDKAMIWMNDHMMW